MIDELVNKYVNEQEENGVRRLITRFGGIQGFADAINVGVDVVKSWQKSNQVPNGFKSRVRKAVAGDIIRGVKIKLGNENLV